MFIIERGGHMGLWWTEEKEIFLEKETIVFPSRSSCLEYLEKIHGREKAVDLIVTMKENKGKLYSF